MKQYVCSICEYVYDERRGNPEAGIEPGTKWEDLPEDWVCPLCGALKSDFVQQDVQNADEKESKPIKPFIESHDDIKELSELEVSVLCSNLARACEKMYKFDEEAKFKELSDYFKAGANPAENSSYEELLKLVEQDLEQGFPNAEYIAKEVGDRGAQRALTWTVKASRMLKSLLSRYEKEGDAMLENTGVYVCTICGYIYIGNDLPDLCPVCKVANWKFEKIEGGVA